MKSDIFKIDLISFALGFYWIGTGVINPILGFYVDFSAGLESTTEALSDNSFDVAVV